MLYAVIHPYVPIVTAFISGGLAGSIATAWFTNHREKSNRLRAFREEIDSIRATIEDARDDRLTETYTENRKAVMILCARIRRGDIYAGVIQKFDSARDAFLRFLENEGEHGAQNLHHAMFPDTPKAEPYRNRFFTDHSG